MNKTYKINNDVKVSRGAPLGNPTYFPQSHRKRLAGLQ